MPKVSVTYSCGHQDRVYIHGPSKDREWKKRRIEMQMCPECFQKHVQDKNKESEALAAELGFPQLEGTEKQAAWANTIRLAWHEKLQQVTEEDVKRWREYNFIEGLTMEEVHNIFDYIFKKKTKASFYIDRRKFTVYEIIDDVRDEFKDAASISEQASDPIDEQLADEVKAESTVFPKEPITNVAAEITIKNNAIHVEFEKNETFRKLVKELGYAWNGSAWEKKITETTGSAEERAAELGNKLLNAGFPICIYDEEVRQNAIDGNFEPECTRWILHRKDTTKLAITWKEYDTSLYQKARTLPGAKWHKGAMLVDVAHYLEVEEFAELYRFKFSQAAKQLIDEHKAQLEKALYVDPKKVEVVEEKDGFEEILKQGDEIIDDLRDDDDETTNQTI